MKPTAMIKADFITSVVLIAFSIAYMVESYRMPRLEAQNINPWSAPGVVPGFLGLILLVLGLVLFVRSVFKGGHRLGWTAATARQTFVQPSMFRLGATALLCLLLFIFPDRIEGLLRALVAVGSSGGKISP